MSAQSILRGLLVYLSRRRKAVPIGLELRITRLRADVRRGGRGSDLAAAELRGITTTILALRR